MKTLKLTILIAIAFIVGAYTTHLYASAQRMILVPEYVGGYNTVDLLEYVAKLKAKEDTKVTPPTKVKEVIKPTVKPINNERNTSA